VKLLIDIDVSAHYAYMILTTKNYKNKAASQQFLLLLQIIHLKPLYLKQNILYPQNKLLAGQCAVRILELLFCLD